LQTNANNNVFTSLTSILGNLQSTINSLRNNPGMSNGSIISPQLNALTNQVNSMQAQTQYNTNSQYNTPTGTQTVNAVSPNSTVSNAYTPTQGATTFRFKKSDPFFSNNKMSNTLKNYINHNRYSEAEEYRFKQTFKSKI